MSDSTPEGTPDTPVPPTAAEPTGLPVAPPVVAGAYAPPAAQFGASGPRASFGRRLVAVIVDGILLGILSEILQLALGCGAATGISVLVGLIYFSYFEGSPSGQTAGKRLLGIRVYDFGGSGQGIGLGRGIIRYLGRYVSTIPCLLGYWWMLWDKEKQTWHDKFASTVVVPVSQYPVEKWPG